MPDGRRFTHLLCGRIHVRRADQNDEAIAEIATRQSGIVVRAQLLELGLGRRSIDHRLSTGRLRRIHPGVYAVGHEAIGHAGLALAAVAAVAPGCASHSTAVALWGLGDLRTSPIQVSAGRPRRPLQGVVVHRAALPPDDMALVEGIPVTTVARTILDESAVRSRQGLRRLVKEAEFAGFVDRNALTAVLARHPRRRGRRALARIVDEYTLDAGRTRSELEDRFLAFCASRGLPMPESNVILDLPGGKIEVDCVWREARLVVELDGRQAHATEAAFEADRARDRRLVAAGWTPMRVTWTHLHRDPDTLEREIRGALDARTADARRSAHTIGA